MLLKRLSAVLIAIYLIAMLFSGCGGSANNVETAANNSNTGSTDSNKAGNMNKTGLPIVKDKVTFKAAMVIMPYTGKLDTMPFFKKLEDKTNVHIKWDSIPVANAVDKKNLMLASGDLPDIFFGTQIINADDIAKYAPQGIFLPLDNLIDQYAPNVKAAFEKSPSFKKTCINVDDGKIYAIGRAAERETQYGQDNMFIYKPWLDKLGLKVPETTDDFYTVLKAFKERDPNGNGKQDEVPFSFSYGDKAYDYHSLFGAFGRIDYTAPAGSYASHFVVDNGKLVYTADKQEYKDAIKFYNKFFQEGLFDKEGLTAKDTKALIAKGNSQEVILGSFMGFDSNNVVGPKRMNDYVPLGPLKGPGGKQIWSKSGQSNGNISGNGFTITKSIKSPEIAVRWVDQLFDKPTSVEAFLGVEGIGIKKGSSGMYEYIDTPQGMSYTDFRFSNAPVHVPCAIFADEWNKVVKVMGEDEFKLGVIDKYYKPYWTNVIPFMKYNKTETQFLQTAGKDIDEYAEQMQMKWLLDGGIDNDWDAYLAKLKQLKLDDYIKVVQGAYDRWNTK